ncbi:MAG: GtrA family protein [Fibromonadaceae bacterium]|nr:GtrA family protein [Fibromonadaceae bacterium]
MKLAVIFDEKFFKFILVGIINTVVGSAIMFLLYNIAHLSYWVSSACNYFFVSILSFFLNKYFTFTIKKWSLFMIVAFILNIVLSYFIAYGLAKPLINYFLDSEPQNIRENVALFVGMCLFTGLNYLGQRFVVFKKR